MLKSFMFAIFVSILLFPVLIWSQQGILTLEQCIQFALKKNPEIQMQRADQEAAQHKVRELNAKLLPKFDVSTSYRHQSMVPEIDMGSKMSLPIPITIDPVQIGAFDHYEAKVAFSQPLYTGSRLRNAVRISQAQGEAAMAQSLQTESNVILKVKSAYMNLLRAQKVLAIAETAREQMSVHLRDVDNFVLQGFARKNELLKAQVKLSETELAVVQAKNAVLLTLAVLENVTGFDFEDDLQVETLEIGDIEVPDLQESIAKATSQRSELQVIHHNLEAAKRGISIAKGERYPSVAAFGSFAYGKPGLDYIKNEWMDYWIVGVGAEWNLWNWGETRSKIQQAHLTTSKLENLKEQLQSAIELEVTQVCLKIREAANRIDVTRQLVDQAQETFRVTENSYKQGQVSNTEYLDAQMDFTRARIECAQAEIDYNLAKAYWEKSVGDISQ